MRVVGIAERIGSNVDVVGVVAALLAAFDIDNANIAHLVPERVHVVARYPCLAAVVYAGNEVADILLFLLDALFYFERISDALLADNLLPILVLHLDLVFHGSVVPDFGNLGSRNQPLLEIRAAAEHGGVVGRGVILAAYSREAQQYGELAQRRSYRAASVLPRLASHLDHEVADGVVLAQERNAFYVVFLQVAFLPVGVINVADTP